MRAMSSWMTTVLPRPAPPNSPALPPRRNGVSRSMTLMPVSNTSALGVRSVNSGGWRWIGRYPPPAVMGPRLSIGSPDRVEHAAKGFLAHGHRERAAGVGHFRPAPQAVGRSQRDGADASAAQVRGDFAG